jgi:hypothetical protein
VATKRTGRSAERTEVNRNIRRAVERFEAPALAGNETWDFLCECGDEDCGQWVTLTLKGYEALLRADEPVLAPGHALSRNQRARRKARKLVDDAQALRAQAEVQHKRALDRNAGREE